MIIPFLATSHRASAVGGAGPREMRNRDRRPSAVSPVSRSMKYGTPFGLRRLAHLTAAPTPKCRHCPPRYCTVTGLAGGRATSGAGRNFYSVATQATSRFMRGSQRWSRRSPPTAGYQFFDQALTQAQSRRVHTGTSTHRALVRGRYRLGIK